jgi:hypothetical protein
MPTAPGVDCNLISKVSRDAMKHAISVERHVRIILVIRLQCDAIYCPSPIFSPTHRSATPLALPPKQQSNHRSRAHPPASITIQPDFTLPLPLGKSPSSYRSLSKQYYSAAQKDTPHPQPATPSRASSPAPRYCSSPPS